MKNFITHKWILTIVFCFVSILSVFAQDNVIDEVVWVIGDEAILKSDIEQKKLLDLSEGRKFDGDPSCVISEELAIQKLYMHQAALDSISVSDNDILPHLDAMEKEYIAAIGSKEKLEEYFNMKLPQMRDVWRENIRTGQTVQKMQQKLVGDIKVTPAEVREFYKALPKDSIPYVPTEVEVQIITQKPKIPDSEIEDVKARLREYTERVEKGETSFSALAALYSEDKASAVQGGELDFMGRGQLDPDFANVAFNLTTPNQISKIVKSEYGYHIIQLVEKRGDRIKVRHILLKPHIPDASITSSIARLDSIGDDIRNKKFSFEEAATILSMDKDTRLNHGIMVNQNSNTAKFQMEELPSETAKVVDKLSVGELSKAYTMMDRNGDEVCVIAKLKNRINGHKATITDDYQSVKDMLLNKRREEILTKWIADKQKRTYIRINPSWVKCNFKYPGWIKKNQTQSEDKDKD
jgi:peptidyl-prolyl cis-trans isomerase SurA